MCFDRNINGNRDVKILECDYLSVQRCVTHFKKMPTHSHLIRTDDLQVQAFYQVTIIFNILWILHIYSENSLAAFMLHNMPCIFSKGIEKCQKLTTWDTFRQECWKSTSKKKHKISAHFGMISCLKEHSYF